MEWYIVLTQDQFAQTPARVGGTERHFHDPGLPLLLTARPEQKDPHTDRQRASKDLKAARNKHKKGGLMPISASFCMSENRDYGSTTFRFRKGFAKFAFWLRCVGNCHHYTESLRLILAVQFPDACLFRYPPQKKETIYFRSLRWLFRIVEVSTVELEARNNIYISSHLGNEIRKLEAELLAIT